MSSGLFKVFVESWLQASNQYRNTKHLYPVMANGIRTGDPCGFNKGRSTKFHEGSQVRQTPEEGRRTYRPKRCGNNNKDEDNSPKTLNDKNHKYFMYMYEEDLALSNLQWLICHKAQLNQIIYI